ncbi:hypothetical protein E4191_14305 [Paracoccus liaowanqingii]|uniref:LPS export ABC transporter periplasmic protein LptC n=2 Tax=Paracoccus liaowanqingii TaxID=2560053 RepID=A0A4P7HQY3_9RHOB|nr:hypothetical protein [Paracoccus liaowanqingii]QBX35731.1 hypothetical protein E4191_14305 [Paracoccus liaowanqingii]
MSRTRIVRWLRVLLPLVALAMLSTMFLFSRRSDTESRIPYAEVEAEAAAREGRIVAPDYSAVTPDGARLSLRAAQATPSAEGGGAAGDLRLDWQRPGGADGDLTARLTAPQGGLADGQVRLEGGVRMTTSSGWQLDAARIEARLDASVITATQGVEAVAPFGRITAGQMRLAPRAPGPDGDAAPGPDGAILNFSDGVRLIYQP